MQFLMLAIWPYAAGGRRARHGRREWWSVAADAARAPLREAAGDPARRRKSGWRWRCVLRRQRRRLAAGARRADGVLPALAVAVGGGRRGYGRCAGADPRRRSGSSRRCRGARRRRAHHRRRARAAGRAARRPRRSIRRACSRDLDPRRSASDRRRSPVRAEQGGSAHPHRRHLAPPCRAAHALGIYHFGQIAAWTPREIAWVADYLALTDEIDPRGLGQPGSPAGRVERSRGGRPGSRGPPQPIRSMKSAIAVASRTARHRRMALARALRR